MLYTTVSKARMSEKPSPNLGIKLSNKILFRKYMKFPGPWVLREVPETPA